MALVRRAVIDVGTNSVKLLVADVLGGEVYPVREDSKQTRLGQGFYETQRLQPEAIAATAKAVAKFANHAHHLQAVSVTVIATSAARDAVNPEALVTAIEQAAQVPVQIISGDQEADWAFQGVVTDPALSNTPLLLLDVGGGSTEFIIGRGKQKHYRESFRLGTVRLLESFPPSDPPTALELADLRGYLREFLQGQVAPQLGPALQAELQALTLVGTGGTTSILARMEASLDEYDRAQIEATRLSVERLRWHVERMWSLPLAERQEIIGLPRKRADVILPGAAIYEAIMEVFGFAELRISTRGLRFAAVMDAHQAISAAEKSLLQ